MIHGLPRCSRQPFFVILKLRMTFYFCFSLHRSMPQDAQSPQQPPALWQLPALPPRIARTASSTSPATASRIRISQMFIPYPPSPSAMPTRWTISAAIQATPHCHSTT